MKELIIEPARETPVFASVDVLVIGAGPAGFSAAINSARLGASTLLVEQSGMVGGVATSGLMSHWTGATRGGFYEEVLEHSTCFPFRNIRASWHTIDHEFLQDTILKLLRGSGARVRLYTLACAPLMEPPGTIAGVFVESKSGREAVRAKVVVDATGDGDIAARAGVPFRLGRAEDGRMQPMTLMFSIGGVDMERAILPGSFESKIRVPGGEIQSLGKENLPFPAGHVLLYPSALPGVVVVNMTNMPGMDGTSAADLTTAHLSARAQVQPIISFLRRFAPGYENCFHLRTASMIGVRETRHFECEYTLSGQDILDATIFDDWVVTKVHFNFDIHNIKGAGLDDAGVQHEFPQDRPYTIPYRCFVPVNIDGLLVAGRNISGTHIAHSSFRVMPICANMGQAVGIAAALCARRGVAPRDLDVCVLQEELKKQGVEP
ncbi:MAG: FAD-dependent oxidoreductase [Promethearchaeota archaeon]